MIENHLKQFAVKTPNIQEGGKIELIYFCFYFILSFCGRGEGGNGLLVSNQILL